MWVSKFESMAAFSIVGESTIKLEIEVQRSGINLEEYIIIRRQKENCIENAQNHME